MSLSSFGGYYYCVYALLVKLAQDFQPSSIHPALFYLLVFSLRNVKYLNEEIIFRNYFERTKGVSILSINREVLYSVFSNMVQPFNFFLLPLLEMVGLRMPQNQSAQMSQNFISAIL